MTIRARMTLWYAGVMFVSLIGIAFFSYYGLDPAHHPDPHASERAKSEEYEENDFGEMLRILAFCGVPAGLLALGGGWLLMRKALAPVTALTRAAEKINEHNLGQKLPTAGSGDEVDRLTEVFNAMTERLNQSFQRIREFTLHASHELKTPLTVMHGELETSLQDEKISPAQRHRLESELDEVQRLTKIVDGLSLLTKADAGQITLERKPVPLGELVQEAYADAQSLARPHEIQVNLDTCINSTILGDRHRLRQLLLNLTDNAVKYNERGGKVTIGLRRADDVAEIVVANTGPGIKTEILPRIFEPFFRGDSSHSHAVEGCGLGLSIARWIAAAHNGTMRITSEPGRLTTAVVRLPLAPSA